MSTVLFGRNRIRNCGSVLRIDGLETLKVETQPLRVSLRTPQHIPVLQTVAVVDNQSQTEDQRVRVVVSDSSVSILFAEFPIVMATAIDPDTVQLRVDLRPLGLGFYDDAEGLHIGSNILTNNEFVDCDNAIGLDSGYGDAVTGQ